MTALTAEQTSEMTSLINNAIRDRKIRKIDAARYEQLYRDDPAIARQLLAGAVEQGGLMEGVVPTEPFNNSEYPAEWLAGNASPNGSGSVTFEEDAPASPPPPPVALTSPPAPSAPARPNVPPPGGGHVTIEP